jgi:hypothetical protein
MDNLIAKFYEGIEVLKSDVAFVKRLASQQEAPHMQLGSDRSPDTSGRSVRHE